MAISKFFTDDDLITQLRLQFNDEGQFDVDFHVFFNQIIDRGNDLYLEFRGRKFSIDKVTGVVTLLNPSNDDNDSSNGDDEE